MCLLDEEEQPCSQQGGRYDEYRRCLGVYPDLLGVCPLDTLLVRGGRAAHPLSTPRKESFLPSTRRCAWPVAASGAMRSSIFWPSSSVTPEASNAPWRCSMNGSCPRSAALHGLVRAREPAFPLGALAL